MKKTINNLKIMDKKLNESLYIGLIDKCHGIINDIDNKIDVIKYSNVQLTEESLTESSGNSELESSLIALLDHLLRVKDSINN